MAARNVSWSGVVYEGPQQFVARYTARQVADGDDLEPEGVSRLGEILEGLMPSLLMLQSVDVLVEADLTRHPCLRSEEPK